MFGINRTSSGQVLDLGVIHHSGESGGDEEENLLSQLFCRRTTSSEVDRKINSIVAPLSTQLGALILSMKEPNERNSTSSTEGNVAPFSCHHVIKWAASLTVFFFPERVFMIFVVFQNKNASNDPGFIGDLLQFCNLTVLLKASRLVSLRNKSTNSSVSKSLSHLYLVFLTINLFANR